MFNIYIERFDNAKAKSMRQVLVVLSNVLLKADDSRASNLRDQAIDRFLCIIIEQKNRLVAKPALHGLAHFLSKDLISISRLAEFRRKPIGDHSSTSEWPESVKYLLRQFLNWIPHHDTGQSASHLIKSFLDKIRKDHAELVETDQLLPIWVEPLVHSICAEPEMILEYRSHVFPHCFQSHLNEYLTFLLYLRLDNHLAVSIASTPHGDLKSGMSVEDEFNLLLAALQAGKELGIIKDTGSLFSFLPDDYCLQTQITDFLAQSRLIMGLSIYRI